MRHMQLRRVLFADSFVPDPKYQVRLTDRERVALRRVVATGTAPARTLTHARILLKADLDGPSWPDAQIAQAVEVGLSTIVRVRRAFVHGGVDAALHCRPPSTTRPPKLDGRQEAHLIALSCSTPPDGRARWSLRLLTDRFVELEGTVVSDETVRRVLKKTHSSRG
jgi:transposase